MARSFLRHIGLDEPLTENKVMSFLRRHDALPFWSEESGLILRRQGQKQEGLLPDKHLVAEETRKEFQRILRVDGKERAKELRLRLKAM